MCVDGHLIDDLKVCTRIPIIRGNFTEQLNESLLHVAATPRHTYLITHSEVCAV